MVDTSFRKMHAGCRLSVKAEAIHLSFYIHHAVGIGYGLYYVYRALRRLRLILCKMFHRHHLSFWSFFIYKTTNTALYYITCVFFLQRQKNSSQDTAGSTVTLVIRTLDTYTL